MDITQTIALAMGAAWASGINLYAGIFVLGALGATGNMDLPPELALLTHPAVIITAGTLYLVEFFADKIPGLDTAWDAIHSFIRIPAGAVLAAGAVGTVAPEWTLIAGLAGGTVAGITHTTKAATRVVANTSPEPVSNMVLSISEDVAVLLGLWAALNYPLVFPRVLGCFLGCCHLAATEALAWGNSAFH